MFLDCKHMKPRQRFLNPTFTKSLWARSEKLCAVPQTGRSLTADRLPLGRELIQPAGTPRHVTETRPLGQGPAQPPLSLELES